MSIHCREIQFLPGRVDGDADHAADDAAINPQPTEAAIPECDDIERVFAVVIPADKAARRARENMIEAGADDPEQEDDDQHVPDMLGVLALPFGYLRGQQRAQHGAAHDEHAVPMYLKRAELK